MCRLAWQLLGMLGNVLGRPRHALQRPRHALQRPRRPRHAYLQGPRSPTLKKTSPTCCLISCEAKGVVYHQVSYMEVWEPKMCRLVWQLLGMLGNVLGDLGMHICKVLGVPHRRKTPPLAAL